MIGERGSSGVSVVLAALGMFLCVSSIVSCTAKKKTADADKPTPSEQSHEVCDKALLFNPQGSDSERIGLKTVRFAYDKSDLTTEAKALLDTDANWIKQHPDLSIQVEGHCDERGSIEYNLSLGERRAQTVKKYLVSVGVESKRLSVISYGEEKPLERGDTEAAYSQNRRANFLPLPR